MVSSNRLVSAARVDGRCGGYSVNVFELSGKDVSASVFDLFSEKRPSETGECALLREDYEAAVQCVQRCRWGKEPRPGEPMLLLGVHELSFGRFLDDNTFG